MKRYYHISFVLIILLLSCNNKAIKQDWNNCTISLCGEKLIGELDMYTPRELILADSFFIVGDLQNNPVYKTFKYNNGNEFTDYSSFGYNGRGPGEFAFPMPINIFKDEIIIGDISLRRFSVFKTSHLVRGNGISPVHIQNFSSKNSFISVIKLDSNLFFGSGSFENSMFAFYHNDSIIETSVPYPEDLIDCGYQQKSLVYQGRLVKQPGGNKMAYSSMYGNIFEIFEIFSHDHVKKVFSYIEEFPEYKPMKNAHNIFSANLLPDCKTGYIISFATKEYIYLLYSGKSASEAKSRKNFSNTIHIWDWTGKPIKRYILDKELSTICVSKDNKHIFGLYNELDLANVEERVGIIRYTINL